MRTRKPEVASFDELLATRYGQPETRLLRSTATMPALLADYYGALPVLPAPLPTAAESRVLSTHVDDARATLVQRRLARPAARMASLPSAQPAFYEPAPAPKRQAMPAAGDARNGQAPEAPWTAERDAAPCPPTSTGPQNFTPVQRLRDGPPNPSGDSSKPMSDDDLLAEIESIVKGQSVYDPVRRKTVPKSELKDRPREPELQPAPDNPRGAAPAGLGGDGQAIFDRIAQSMQYAGAYDLGSVELDNRFADFDRVDGSRGAAAKDKQTQRRTTSPRAEMPVASRVDASDLRADLDSIRQGLAGAGAAAASGLAAGRTYSLFSHQNSLPGGFSSPLYATGEHVLAGDALYKDQLLVGRAPGVLFSYGQIIAMADLFGTVNDMIGTDAAALGTIKSLIERSTAYYRHDGSATVSVSDEDWQRATDGRYLRLAEDNYEHFAPNLLFPDPRFASAAARFGDHRQAWQRHHERAIREAQRMAIDPQLQNVSTLPVLPLVINAFGDHFLTDAFASGHVINKAVVGEVFRDAFFKGRSLSPEGRAFFDRVARQAWHGEVAEQFRQLETAERYDAWWNVVRWHPDIKNAERFASVLQAAAEEAPDQVANLAVKAVHDTLNRDGIDVVNDAGSSPWRLTGDGHLTPQTLAVMRQAVAQSAANITDPSILASSIELGSYFAKVWSYVPKLTPASQGIVKTLVTSLVNPKSAPFVEAAAALIHEECKTLIQVLIDKHALQRI